MGWGAGLSEIMASRAGDLAWLSLKINFFFIEYLLQ